MKRSILFFIFLYMISIFAFGCAPKDDEQPLEEFATAYRFADFAAEEIHPTACALTQIAASDVLMVLTEAQYGDQTIAALLTKDLSRYAALETDGGWSAFHKIGDETYIYDSTIALSTFDGILAHSGITLSYAVGSNAAENLYFTVGDGDVTLLVGCAKQVDALNGMLIEQYGMGSILNLYREIDGKLYRYDLYRELSEIFPNALEIYANFRSNLRYSSHTGLLNIDLMMTEDAQYDRCAGWITEDAMVLIEESDMTLPPYTYTPAELTMDEAALSWLTNEFRFGTDFVLREAVDPTTLEGDALLAFMDEAYLAGQRVLSVYEIDGEMMYGARIYSSTMEHYYVGGRAYYDMQNPAFPTLSAWETYMRRILSDEIVDALMARSQFIEVDGRLYGSGGARGTNIGMRDIGSKIVSATDDEIVYARIVEVREDLDSDAVETREFAFRYTKCEDGWRWTELYIYN